MRKLILLSGLFLFLSAPVAAQSATTFMCPWDIPDGQMLRYAIKGKMLWPLGQELYIPGSYFKQTRDDGTPSRFLLRDVDSNPVNKNPNLMFPHGLALAFFAPDFVHLVPKQKEPQTAVVRLGEYFYTCDIKAEQSKNGWSYTAQYEKDKQKIKNAFGVTIGPGITMLPKLGEGLVPKAISKLKITTTTLYDTGKKRVKSATLNYQIELVDFEPGEAKRPKVEKIKNKITVKVDKQIPLPTTWPAKLELAIARGKNYLWDVYLDHFMQKDRAKASLGWAGRSNRPDEFLGEMGLALYALLNSEFEPKRKKELIKVLDDFFAQCEALGYTQEEAAKHVAHRTLGAYIAPIILMVIDAAKNGGKKSQGVSGGRGYEKTILEESKDLKARAMTLAKACVTLLVQGDKGHIWHYRGRRYVGYPGGYSRAQYAVLGLRSAKALGLDIPQNIWQDIIEGTVKDFRSLPEDPESKEERKPFEAKYGLGLLTNHPKQTDFGGWPYAIDKDGAIVVDDKNIRFNMTCAALGNLAMALTFCEGVKGEAKTTALQTAVNGWAHLQHLLPFYREKRIDCYAYFSFERVAVFYSLETLGGIDWHKELSQNLISEQAMTGEFGRGQKLSGSYGPVIRSAYALLFLKKATKGLSYHVENK